MTPPLRVHKHTGQAYVNLDGRRVYLGKATAAATQQAYVRTVSEWLANGCRIPVAPQEITIAELAERYLDHCKEYYRRPDGTPAPGMHNVRLALIPVCELYSDTHAQDFGPLALRTVREKWIAAGLRRTPSTSELATSSVCSGTV